MGNHNGTDPVGNGITGEHEDGAITGEPDIGKPDLAALHWPKTSSQSTSSSGHASFGQGVDSAVVSGFTE